MTKLLTLGNPKLAKGIKKGYFPAVVHLAPFTASGYNVCPMAELAGCAAACLNTAGRGGIAAGRKTFKAPGGQILPDNAIQAARIRRTKFYMEDRAGFMSQLVHEIEAHIRRAERKGLIPCIRLNGTSDIRWETICAVFPDRKTYLGVKWEPVTIFKLFPGVQFYDYTKLPNRRNLPSNYHLTWSYSEAAERYSGFFPEAVKAGLNVAVVFRSADLPETFRGLPVVDGDETDLRFLDPQGCVVGLKAKGRAKTDQSGFVIDLAA